MVNIKPFKTYEQQLGILVERGLIIDDKAKALKTLRYINYYRFSGYTLTLRNHDTFYNGITFDNILELYNFDAKLRTLILYLIEYVEVSFRTHIAYYHAEKYGPLGYLSGKGFQNQLYHDEFINEFNKIINNDKRNNEVFIKHYKDHYDNKFPIWVAVELVSFGTLSRLYYNSEIEIKKSISIDNYDLKYNYIQNWLHGLVVLRNICAHRGRLYNRPMPIKPKLSNKDKKLNIRNDLVFVYIFLLRKIIINKDVWNVFLVRLSNIIRKYSFVKLSNLGFNQKWCEVLHKE